MASGLETWRVRWLGAILVVAGLAVAAGCEDDSDDVAPERGSGGAGGRGGSDGGGARGTSGDAADARADVVTVMPDAGVVAVNRPERRDFSAALLAQLRTKPGFRIEVAATNVTGARMLAVAPDGSIYVTTPMTSEVWRLRDGNADADFDDPGEKTLAASAMTTPALQGVHGITFHQESVYLASIKSVVRAQLGPTGVFTNFVTLLSDLPDGGQHPNRTLAVGPDGFLYVSVGSDCNACAETNSEDAAMLRLTLAGAAANNPPNPQHPMLARNPMSMISPRVWASGLRNTLGFAWHPVTQELWGMDQGSDGLGGGIPAEELNRLVGGKSYGWPYCYNDRQPDPIIDEPSQTMKKSMYCPMTEPDLARVPAHSSPITFLFYTGAQFPSEYRDDAFLVLRGSWDRPDPVGYKLVRVHFSGGVPAPLPGTSEVTEDFVSGFLIEQGRAHFGRIAGLAIDPGGALLLSDDTNGVIYRISYQSSSGDAGAGDAVDGGAGG